MRITPTVMLLLVASCSFAQIKEVTYVMPGIATVTIPIYVEPRNENAVEAKTGDVVVLKEGETGFTNHDKFNLYKYNDFNLYFRKLGMQGINQNNFEGVKDDTALLRQTGSMQFEGVKPETIIFTYPTLYVKRYFEKQKRYVHTAITKLVDKKKESWLTMYSILIPNNRNTIEVIGYCSTANSDVWLNALEEIVSKMEFKIED